MQIYAMRFFNFLRFGEKNNSIVFDLSSKQKEELKKGTITLDEIYDGVLLNPYEHVKNVKKNGIEGLLGITGITDGDIDTSNGVGKSSIFEGICYAHYEKIVRKTANTDKVEKAGLSVVTKIDGKYPKNLQESYVEEIFESNDKIYRIKRGRTFSKNHKSNTPFIEFECISDGKTDSQAGHRTGDTKEAISDVITMDYDVFVNSQMFGQNDAGKYLMGTDKTRKEMLINLLKLEDVVSGCLELIRVKKNAQDKKVQSIQINIEMLEKLFCDGYGKIKKQNSEIDIMNRQSGFQEEYISFIFFNIELMKMGLREDIRSFDKNISDGESKILELSKSDKLQALVTIKEEGKKTQAEKKAKEEEMTNQISEWKKLKDESEQSKLQKEKQLKDITIKENDANSKIESKTKEIEKFNRKEYDEKMAMVAKAKKADPIYKEKLNKLLAERDFIVENISKHSTIIGACNIEIRKFNNQIKNIKEDGKLICHECKSVVEKEHVIGKINENKSLMEENETVKESLEKDKINKDKEIQDVKSKLQKINDYLVDEGHWVSQLNAFEEKKKSVDEMKVQIVQLREWKDGLSKEIKDISIKCEDYEKKCVSIRNIYVSDINALSSKISELVDKLKNAERDAKEISLQIDDIKTNQKDLASKKSKAIEKIGYLDKEKEGFESNRNSLKEKRNLLQEEQKVLQRLILLEDIFGLDGIQTRIVKKYLPLLNVYIKEFLDILSDGQIIVKMTINERSKVDIEISGGTADTFEMLSGGEKMIVRLATDIGLALLAFSKSAQKPEIILLDEIFGPLDNSHTELVFKMLKKLRDKFSRVMIITHKTEIKEQIKTNIIIEKAAGKYGLSEIKRIE